MATLDSIHVSKKDQEHESLRPALTRRQTYEILLYILLMLIALLLGMYLGGWSLLREEEEERKPELQQHGSNDSFSYCSYLR
ncbi:MAG TPA: hypothetical protein VGJ51_13555 [Candidatus Angelobacter sp.]